MIALKTGEKVFIGVFFRAIVDDLYVNFVAFTLIALKKAADFDLLTLFLIFIVGAAALYCQPSEAFSFLLQRPTGKDSGVHCGDLHGCDLSVDESGF